MSNIDKRALREIAVAAVGAHERLSVMPPDDIFDISLAEGTQLDADITALNALNSAANPATVLALLDELEAAEKRIAELAANNDSAHEALLKARRVTVTMPTGYSVRQGHPINEEERGVMIPKDGGPWLSRFDVEHALHVAGITTKGE